MIGKIDRLGTERKSAQIMIKRAGRKLLLVAELLLVVTASPAVSSFAQTSASSPATAAPPPASPAVAAPLAFEVSVVKQNNSGGSSSSSNFRSGRFTASNVSLKNLLQYQAYGIPESRISGGPKWISSERFDIEAKTDNAVADRLRTLPRDQRTLQTRRMFQQLFADRFKMAVHWETRDLRVYAMVLAKKGPRLQPSKEPDGHSGTSSNNEQFTAQGVTLAQMADALTQEFSRELGRVVTDKTGIQGSYDFALKWMPNSGAALVNGGTDGSAISPDSGPSLFTAIRNNLD
jgi:uncharacterized protein (TIGR03435 family)